MNLNSQIEELDNHKEELTESFDEEKKQFEEKLQTKIIRKQELEGQIKDMTSLITDLNVNRNYLSTNLGELERTETNLVVEKKTLQRKIQTKQVELKQREFEFEKRRQENEILMLKLAEASSGR